MSKGLILEDRIVERLERAGLVTNVEVHADDYDSYIAPGRMGKGNEKKGELPYISFNIEEAGISRDCRKFTGYLLDRLKQTRPEIVGIDYVAAGEEGRLDAYLVLNPVSVIQNKKEFVKESLNALNSALKSYLHNKGIPDPVRD